MTARAAASLLEWLALYEQQHAPPLRFDARACADTLETLLQRAYVHESHFIAVINLSHF